MASKLKEAKTSARMTSSSTTLTTEVKENKEPPAGAKILTKTVRTETEQIENGWLISKNFDISYEIKGDKRWTYYHKKWYSKDNPLEIKLTDASLADEFSADES